MFIRDVNTFFGVIRLESDGNHLTGCRAVEAQSQYLDDPPLLLKAQKELEAYVTGSLPSFDIPLAPTGTLFQKNVWNELLKIPYGETRTYGEIARLLGKEKACRAVGRACGQNPIWIFIPCHRVIGAGGELGGYAGGTGMKKILLSLEKRT